MEQLKHKFDNSNIDKIDERLEKKDPILLSKISKYLGDELPQLFEDYNYEQASELYSEYLKKRTEEEDRLIREFVFRKSPEFIEYQAQLLAKIKK